jgi:hypothetical protein
MVGELGREAEVRSISVSHDGELSDSYNDLPVLISSFQKLLSPYMIRLLPCNVAESFRFRIQQGLRHC